MKSESLGAVATSEKHHRGILRMLMPRIRDRLQEITERSSFTAKADSTLK
jgi:hypothetical protein